MPGWALPEAGQGVFMPLGLHDAQQAQPITAGVPTSDDM